MTLVELMVSIAILTAIILIVSTLLASAQRVVGTSQETIRADADARVIAERLRADLSGLTSEGFLAIYTGAGDRQHLLFTTVGPYRSMTETGNPTIANAARIDYGLTGGANNILWRRAFLLNGESGAPTGGDMEKISLAEYKTWPRVNFDFALYNGGEEYLWDGNPFKCFIMPPSPEMTLPPNSLSEVKALWPYLARPCSNLKIEWTDGECDATTKMLLWYNSASPKEAAWVDRDVAVDAIEYDADLTVGDDRYCALWTHGNKDNWPSALRITFTLGKGGTAQTYEIIVDLPR
ncbi:MAG: hypothetical protein SVV80_14390 [Planctomycetota bacterium]|nr:hypothetical protein [Planctomycetota bacterium]